MYIEYRRIYNIHVRDPSIQQTAPGLWIQSKAWDAFWILSSIWLLFGLLLATIANAEPIFITCCLTVGVLFSSFHTAGSLSTYFFSPQLAPYRRSQWFKFFLIPALISAITIGLVTIGVKYDLSIFAENTRNHFNTYILLATVYFSWNTWHCSFQHFGVFSIYRLRAGRDEPRFRAFDKYYCLFLTFVLVPLTWFDEQRHLGFIFQYFPPPSKGFFSGVIAIYLAIASFVLFTGVELLTRSPSPPRILYAATVALQPIMSFISFELYLLFFQLPHWITETGILSRVHINYAKKVGVTKNYFSSVWLCLLAFLALVVIYSMNKGSNFLGSWYRTGRFDYAVLDNGISDMNLILLQGSFLSFVFLHFYVETYLYRASDQVTRDGIIAHILSDR